MQTGRPRSRQPTIEELLNNSVLDEIAANRNDPEDDPTELSSAPPRPADASLFSQDAATDNAARSGLGTQQVVLPEEPIEELAARPATALRLAQEAFVQTGYWVAFYRAILSAKGVVAKLFPSRAEQRHFQGSTEFAEIYKILTALREQDNEKSSAVEPLRTLTIRIPESLHEKLAMEATDLETSVNKLCISKLLLPAPAEFVPKEVRQPRGRKPQIRCSDKNQTSQIEEKNGA
jgi:predicted HicB family RNase H-like nuclease